MAGPPAARDPLAVALADVARAVRDEVWAAVSAAEAARHGWPVAPVAGRPAAPSAAADGAAVAPPTPSDAAAAGLAAPLPAGPLPAGPLPAGPPGDVQYGVDAVADRALRGAVHRLAPAIGAVRLVAEGLPPAGEVIGDGPVRWRLLADPLDGTRLLSHGKRSGWVLAAVAAEPADGQPPWLSASVAAVAAEVPVPAQASADLFWAARGGGVVGLREAVGAAAGAPARRLTVRPDPATDLAHGYATVAHFFPGAGATLAAVADRWAARLGGPVRTGEARWFSDQYAATGGQLLGLVTGRDRVVADLRPLVPGVGICAHPYDLAAALVATEAGVVLRGAGGEPFDAPMTVDADVAWVGFASAALAARVGPALWAAVRELRER